MIDKGKRLKLYSDKDYSENIDFPVELVGRDGVVRKYSYADSIRIYERRIESAHIRYSDWEVINAEIYHCSKRLEQIRRSWTQRMSSSERQFIETRRVPKERELYERGKQFLRQLLEEVQPGITHQPDLAALNLVNLEDQGDFQVFYVNSPLFHPGTLLYLWRLEGARADEHRQAYEAYLRILGHHTLCQDSEKLIHHTLQRDLAIILAGPRADLQLRPRLHGFSAEVVPPPPASSELAWLEGALGREDMPAAGPFRQALEALRRGELPQAFDLFKLAVDENPFHKEAYWAIAAIAGHIERLEEAETYLFMGLRYFPDDPRLHLYTGFARLRAGEHAEAEEAFDAALRLGLRLSRAYGFLACTQAFRGDLSAAVSSVERGLAAFPRDKSLLNLVVPLRRQLAARARFQAVAIVLLTTGLLWLIFGGGWLPIGGMAGLVVLLAAVFALMIRRERRQLWEWLRADQ